MPCTANGGTASVSAILLEDFVLLPVPKKDIAVPISTHQELSIRTKCHFAGVPRDTVTGELFLFLHGKLVASLKDGNRIVQTLANEKSLRRVHDQTRHGMHGRVANVLDGDTNIPFPNENLLVITGGDHFRSIVFDKQNGVDGRQMMIVLLGDFRRRSIVCDNLVVAAANDKEVVVVGIKLHNERHLTVGKGLDNRP